MLALLMALATGANAGERGNCWIEAGERYGVSPWLLYAIARVESGLDPRAHEQLEDSESRGMMQVNSFWYPQLKKAGIDPENLWEPCTNIHVGAWILSQEIRRYGNRWLAVGAYNAGAFTEETKNWKLRYYLNYTDKVKKELARIAAALQSPPRTSSQTLTAGNTTQESSVSRPSDDIQVASLQNDKPNNCIDAISRSAASIQCSSIGH